MKTVTNIIYSAFALLSLGIGLLPANSATGDLLASINGPSGAIYSYTHAGVRSVVASGFPRPRGMVFDTAGNLFVSTIPCSSTCEAQILKITPSGTSNVFATVNGNFAGSGLAIDNSGNLFLMVQNLDDPNFVSTIFKFAPDGTRSTFVSLSLVKVSISPLTATAISSSPIREFKLSISSHLTALRRFLLDQRHLVLRNSPSD